MLFNVDNKLYTCNVITLENKIQSTANYNSNLQADACTINFSAAEHHSHSNSHSEILLLILHFFFVEVQLQRLFLRNNHLHLSNESSSAFLIGFFKMDSRSTSDPSRSILANKYLAFRMCVILCFTTVLVSVV